MQPPRMVNDFSGLLSQGERSRLEQELREFYAQTSSQIYIVTVDDLHGHDIAQYSFLLGEAWGIGTRGKDNGILILIHPSPDKKHGDAFIATGYGLEGSVPDITCNHIVTFDIIPHFKQLDYFGGLQAAVKTIMDLTRGEYTADEYLQRKKEAAQGPPVGLIFIFPLIIIFLSAFGRSRRARVSSTGHRFPFWLALFMLGGSGSHHRGSFGNFSSGSGSFGGFGGGFGGGGGGSFGGGGAGGSW